MSASSLRAPSLVEIFVGSILAVVLGAVVAATILLLKPVEILTETPKDKALDPTRIYYLQGRKEYTASQRWRFKRDSLTQGHTVSVNEDELNAWIEEIYPKLAIETKPRTTKPAAKKPGEKAPAKKPEPAQPFIQTGTPNFRLTSDTLRVGVVYYVNVFGYASFEVVAQCDGTFEKPKKGDEPVYFRPSTFYLGSLPVHKLLGLKRIIFGQVVDTFELPAELEATWAKLADVKVQNRELVLGMPASAGEAH
ncbi:MAG TPA: hypothetical protein VK163_15660 [Opitutaceae bacterium]|nr:hypothetical protein [Opitutaceae bacterium]